MDKQTNSQTDALAQRLKLDAERIDVQVSDDLEQRILASLHAVAAERQPARQPSQRPKWLWWASSLTGVAAALVFLAIANFQTEKEVRPPADTAISPVPLAATPVLDLKTESAMLTSPLRDELRDLQSDMKKAEQKVRRDIGL